MGYADQAIYKCLSVNKELRNYENPDNTILEKHLIGEEMNTLTKP